MAVDDYGLLGSAVTVGLRFAAERISGHLDRNCSVAAELRVNRVCDGDVFEVVCFKGSRWIADRPLSCRATPNGGNDGWLCSVLDADRDDSVVFDLVHEVDFQPVFVASPSGGGGRWIFCVACVLVSSFGSASSALAPSRNTHL